MQTRNLEDEEQHQANGRAIEAIEPTAKPAAMVREITFTRWMLPDGRDAGTRVFTQAPLGMFPAQEFVKIIKDVFKQFTEGDMGEKIGELFSGGIEMPDMANPDAVSGVVKENMLLIEGLYKLIDEVPELQLDLICLSLGVRRMERPWVKEMLQEPPHRGGLSVDEAFDILNVFILQNGAMLREKLVGNAQSLVKTFRLEVLGQDLEKVTPPAQEETPVTAADESSSVSRGGTPSSTSAQPTPASV